MTLSSLTQLASVCSQPTFLFEQRGERGGDPCDCDSDIVCNKVCVELLQKLRYKPASLHYQKLKNIRYKDAIVNNNGKVIITKWVCENCFTREFVQKRNGPNGTNTLCNKCGIRFKRNQYTELPLPPLDYAYAKGRKLKKTRTA